MRSVLCACLVVVLVGCHSAGQCPTAGNTAAPAVVAPAGDGGSSVGQAEPVKEAPAAPVKAVSAPPGVTFEGGDGSSMEQPIVIKGATEDSGVAAEYRWIAHKYPIHGGITQMLLASGAKSYDLLEFAVPSGEQVNVYFDITDFFGKF